MLVIGLLRDSANVTSKQLHIIESKRNKDYSESVEHVGITEIISSKVGVYYSSICGEKAYDFEVLKIDDPNEICSKCMTVLRKNLGGLIVKED